MRYLFTVVFMLWGAVANAVTIETVPVGNAGNLPDSEVMYPDETTGYGAVAYDYRIGKYEVTVGQYTEFLNAIAATDTHGLYNPSMASVSIIAGIARSGVSGSYTYSVIGSPNKPVTYVSWGDAARFANWLENGQPTGLQDATTTEDGAYSLNGANTDASLNAATRNANATWVLASEHEWYKAAYHANDGPTEHYWDYPTATNIPTYSDQPPGNDAPNPANTGNFYKADFDDFNGYNDGYAVTGSSSPTGQNLLTDVGAYTLSTSPYGTYDQGGNVAEWNEGFVEISSGTARSVRAGSHSQNSLIAWIRFGYLPTLETHVIGFRVAMVPEPSTMALAVCGVLALIACSWRRGIAKRHE